MNNFTDEEKDAIESWTTNKDEYKLIKESLKDSYSANADSKIKGDRLLLCIFPRSSSLI